MMVSSSSSASSLLATIRQVNSPGESGPPLAEPQAIAGRGQDEGRQHSLQRGCGASNPKGLDLGVHRFRIATSYRPTQLFTGFHRGRPHPGSSAGQVLPSPSKEPWWMGCARALAVGDVECAEVPS